MIEARELSIRAPGPRGRLLLNQVSLEVRPGEVLAVIGPNGAGKSSLLRGLSGESRAAAGRVLVEGRPIIAWRPLDLARRRAVVAQHQSLAFPMRAAEVVALGRAPWHGLNTPEQDARSVERALERAGVAHLSEQAFATLSGGERQRVAFARALAQLDGPHRPAALLLDEPTASLDVCHRGSLLSELRGLASNGLAVLVVLHDLNEARFVADRVAVVTQGRVVGCGPPEHVLTLAAMTKVFGAPFRASSDGSLLPAYDRG